MTPIESKKTEEPVMHDHDNDITLGSGNVFDDLGLSQPDEALAKADLALQIRSIAKHRHLSQAETARLLGTTQPKVSDLFAGKIAGFSLERLIRFLMALNRDVTLVIAPMSRSSEHASLRVMESRSSAEYRRSISGDTTLVAFECDAPYGEADEKHM